MITKEDLVNLYGYETKTTAKVIRAIPEDKLDFTVHDRSSTVKTLLKTFAVEMVMNLSFLKGEEPKESMDQVGDFDTIEAGAVEFEKRVQDFMNALNATSEEGLQQSMTLWGMTQSRAMFVFMLACDMIHHRGQLSVYVRLAGGKVPSIYGPSADDNGGF